MPSFLSGHTWQPTLCNTRLRYWLATCRSTVNMYIIVLAKERHVGSRLSSVAYCGTLSPGFGCLCVLVHPDLHWQSLHLLGSVKACDMQFIHSLSPLPAPLSLLPCSARACWATRSPSQTSSTPSLFSTGVRAHTEQQFSRLIYIASRLKIH